MSFADAVQSAFRQYAGFEGRARRSEYWYFYLFSTLVVLVPYLFAVAVVVSTGGAETRTQAGPSLVVVGIILLLIGLVSVALFLPSLAVTWRRLHDTGRSGLWFFIAYVPLVGPVVLLVFLLQDSLPGPNQYGPSPKPPVRWQGYDTGYLAPLV